MSSTASTAKKAAGTGAKKQRKPEETKAEHGAAEQALLVRTVTADKVRL
jgi:hypothetical protein